MKICETSSKKINKEWGMSKSDHRPLLWYAIWDTLKSLNVWTDADDHTSWTTVVQTLAIPANYYMIVFPSGCCMGCNHQSIQCCHRGLSLGWFEAWFSNKVRHKAVTKISATRPERNRLKLGRVNISDWRQTTAQGDARRAIVTVRLSMGHWASDRKDRNEPTTAAWQMLPRGC